MMMFADGFDDCIIGITSGDFGPQLVVYSCEKMIEKLARDIGGSDPEDEAMEYLQYNTWGAYVGKHTPIFVWTEYKRGDE